MDQFERFARANAAQRSVVGGLPLEVKACHDRPDPNLAPIFSYQ